MPDREKVIKGLECHRIDDNHRINCTDCPYYVDDDNHIRCVNDLHDDAVVLLKEQKHKDKMFHALEDDWKRLKELLKEQKEQIRQLTEELEELRKKRNEVYYSGYDGSFIL